MSVGAKTLLAPSIVPVGEELYARMQRLQNDPVLQRLRPKGVPVLFEDEGMEMGESSLHKQSCDILQYGVEFHLSGQLAHRVLGNLNLYYAKDDPTAYVSPDVMVVKARRSLPTDIWSYELGKDGPIPVLVAEVMSYRTDQEEI